MTADADVQAKARTLKALHEAPEILRVVNVWDPITAKVVSDLEGTAAVATAGHSIAASHGFPDGEMPLELLLAAVERIVQATGLPVSADFDAGFGQPGEVTRRAIGVGVVGANVEDRLQPFEESVAVMEQVVAAARAEGLDDFQLNARTDVFVRGQDLSDEQKVAEAIRRGQAFLDVGAALVFVPGVLDAEVTRALVAGIGERKVSVIGLPGALRAAEYEALGVARISYGPLTQRVALAAYRDLALDLYGDGVIPEDTPALN